MYGISQDTDKIKVCEESPYAFPVDVRGADASPDKAQVRSPQVRVHTKVLSRELSNQRDVIERLLNRLEPILSIAPKLSGGEIEKQRPEPTTPLAASLSALGNQVAAHTLILEAILSRIEV
jgi:hypothetical protein